MYIFGGDRHLMAFNDLYSFDLAKGIKSLELYNNSNKQIQNNNQNNEAIKNNQNEANNKLNDPSGK